MSNYWDWICGFYNTINILCAHVYSKNFSPLIKNMKELCCSGKSHEENIPVCSLW